MCFSGAIQRAEATQEDRKDSLVASIDMVSCNCERIVELIRAPAHCGRLKHRHRYDGRGAISLRDHD